MGASDLVPPLMCRTLAWSAQVELRSMEEYSEAPERSGTEELVSDLIHNCGSYRSYVLLLFLLHSVLKSPIVVFRQ